MMLPSGDCQTTRRSMAAKLKQWVDPPWLRELIQTELEPGESIEAMADFTSTVRDSAGKPQVVTRLFVLTDRYLRSFGLKMTLASMVGVRSSKPRPIASSYAIPLHQISSIGETREGSYFVPEARTVAFTGPTGPETWRTVFVQGARVVDLLKAKVSAGAPKPIGVADELSKLAALKEEGILTDEEFQRSKALFVGATPDQQSEALDLLRQLHALQRSGVLSEMEFNMKKWDVLSRPERRPPG
jgi:Short C-terminal domain